MQLIFECDGRSQLTAQLSPEALSAPAGAIINDKRLSHLAPSAEIPRHETAMMPKRGVWICRRHPESCKVRLPNPADSGRGPKRLNFQMISTSGSFRYLARVTGLEPATSGVTGRHSNQLSYARAGGRC